MTTEVQAIVAHVLSLPAATRDEVLTHLIEGLDGEQPLSTEAQAEREAVWKAEIARRVQEIEMGQAELLDGDRALAEIRKKFGA